MNGQASGAAFVEAISREALQSAAINHPYLDAMRLGDFPDPGAAYKDFAFQYGLYSQRFIRYLSAVTENLSDPGHKRILLSNLDEESGDTHDLDLPPEVFASIVGQPHASLFRRFQDALGVDTKVLEVAENSQPGASWSQGFLQLCQTDEYVGIGAIGIGTELIVSRIYRQILEGLAAHSALTPTQRVFFDLHSHCDDEHGAQMAAIAEDLATDPAACDRIAHGTRMAIRLRVEFWDELLQRAQGLPATKTAATGNLSAFGY